jgi:AraC-like DNA-binding protein
MVSRSYYRIITDADNNFKSDKTFLHVNCTGQHFFTKEVKAYTSRHDYYLIYLCNGTIYLNRPIKSQMSPGDVIIFQPECKFDYFKPQGIDMEYYWVHFTGYGVSEFLQQCEIETNKIVTIGYQQGICDGFSKMFDTFLLRNKLFDIESAHNLSSILINISKYGSDELTDSSQKYLKIGKSLSYIHSNISQAIEVGTLATIEHMSISHFRAVFHKLIGLSPKEYIILSKLNYSCELMRQTDMNINEISESVGYYDAQYFSRIFNKHYGLSPTAYRAQNKT